MCRPYNWYMFKGTCLFIFGATAYVFLFNSMFVHLMICAGWKNYDFHCRLYRSNRASLVSYKHTLLSKKKIATVISPLILSWRGEHTFQLVWKKLSKLKGGGMRVLAIPIERKLTKFYQYQALMFSYFVLNFWLASKLLRFLKIILTIDFFLFLKRKNKCLPSKPPLWVRKIRRYCQTCVFVNNAIHQKRVNQFNCRYLKQKFKMQHSGEKEWQNPWDFIDIVK